MGSEAGEGNLAGFLVGRPGAVPREAGQRDKTVYTFNPDGTIDHIVGPRGDRTDFEYNARGQVKKVTSRSIPVWVSAGTPRQMQDLVTEFEYDDTLANVKAVITPLGHRTEYEYDDAGNVIQTANAAGDTTRFHVNILTNQPDSISRRDRDREEQPWITAKFTYDLDGNRITHKGSPREGTRRWFPDRLGRDSVMQDELGNQELRLYDLAGNLTLFRSRQGDEVHYEYDAAGRLERQIVDAVVVDDEFEQDSVYGLPIGTVLVPADLIEFEYDSMGRPARIENQHAIVRRTYAPEGAILEEVDTLKWTGEEYVVEYTYTPSGARKTLTTPSDRVFTYVYGPGGVLDQIQVSTGGTVAFRWDHLGRRDSVFLPPIGSMADGVSTVYRYDADGRIRQILAEHPALSTPMLNMAWPSYDAAGRPLRMDDSASTPSLQTFWEYDGLGQLDSVVTVGGTPVFARRYRYDESGNRTFERGLASAAIDSVHFEMQAGTNRLLWRNERWDTILVPERYRYDGAGNLVYDSTFLRPVSGSAIRENHIYRYFYDALGRLAGGSYKVEPYTVIPGSPPKPDMPFVATIETRYDGLGRLLYRSKPGLGAHRFLYDGDNVLAVDRHEILHGGGVDDPLIVYAAPNSEPLMCNGEPGYFATHQGRLLRFYAPTDGEDCTTALPGWDAAGQFAGAIAGSFSFELARQGQDAMG